MLWCERIGAAHVAERGIARAIAATARGHRLTLRQGIEALGKRVANDVPATILIGVGGRRSREGDESLRAQRGDGRGAQDRKSAHVCFLS